MEDFSFRDSQLLPHYCDDRPSMLSAPPRGLEPCHTAAAGVNSSLDGSWVLGIHSLQGSGVLGVWEDEGILPGAPRLLADLLSPPVANAPPTFS